MILKCKNIGKLDSADVEINTITLIAGKNSTGKSTVGKLLYCIFNSLYNLENEATHKLESILRRYIGEDDFVFEPSYDKVRLCVNELITKRNIAELNETREIIKSYMGDDFLKSKKESFFSDIVDFLNISNDVIYRSLLQNKLNQEFDRQIRNLYIPNKDSSVSLKIGKKDINVSLQNNEVESLENFINLKTEVIYIDDPFILDNLNIRSNPYIGHRGDLLKKLRSTIDSDTDVEEVIKQIHLSNKSENIYQKLDSVCKGIIVHDPKEGFNFKLEDTKENLKLVNISTGLKAFVIIKTLLLNSLLEKKGTIVLDEPEIHLHPEWQKLLAEVIVMIQKEFDMHILINSHSPYFINAIDVYARKYQIRDTCKFYLSKELDSSGKTATLEDVSDNIEEINKLLFIPLQELENERSEIESEDADD